MIMELTSIKKLQELIDNNYKIEQSTADIWI